MARTTRTARTAPTAPKTKIPKPGLRTWKPQADDAVRLAALRWFALEIERMGIEIYASDRRKYRLMEDLLRGTLKGLGRIGKQVKRTSLDDSDCPPGWTLCRDGLCAPMCDGYQENL